MSIKSDLCDFVFSHDICLDELSGVCGCTVHRLRRELLGDAALSGELYFMLCSALRLPLDFFVGLKPESDKGGEHANQKTV